MSTTTQEQAAVWQLDPAHTLVEFSARHMMVTTVKGHFTGVSGMIIFDERDLTRSSVKATIDATTIDTGVEQRNTHLKSADFLEVEQYPTITFQSTRVEGNQSDRFKVIGDLTIHGVTREVVLNVEYNGSAKTPFGTTVAGFTATTTINRKDFDLNWNVALEVGGWLVGDILKISIETEAILQS
ncbi:MAG: YceI family protein [Chloroflexi bacterium]|nr:YceI family protein [Chloroflexota bacterium]